MHAEGPYNPETFHMQYAACYTYYPTYAYCIIFIVQVESVGRHNYASKMLPFLFYPCSVEVQSDDPTKYTYKFSPCTPMDCETGATDGVVSTHNCLLIMCLGLH